MDLDFSFVDKNKKAFQKKAGSRCRVFQSAPEAVGLCFLPVDLVSARSTPAQGQFPTGGQPQRAAFPSSGEVHNFCRHVDAWLQASHELHALHDVMLGIFDRANAAHEMCNMQVSRANSGSDARYMSTCCLTQSSGDIKSAHQLSSNLIKPTKPSYGDS